MNSNKFNSAALACLLVGIVLTIFWKVSDMDALLVLAIIFGAVALAFALFSSIVRRSQPQPTRTGDWEKFVADQNDPKKPSRHPRGGVGTVARPPN